MTMFVSALKTLLRRRKSILRIADAIKHVTQVRDLIEFE